MQRHRVQYKCRIVKVMEKNQSQTDRQGEDGDILCRSRDYHRRKRVRKVEGRDSEKRRYPRPGTVCERQTKFKGAGPCRFVRKEERRACSNRRHVNRTHMCEEKDCSNSQLDEMLRVDDDGITGRWPSSIAGAPPDWPDCSRSAGTRGLAARPLWRGCGHPRRGTHSRRP